MPTRPQNGRMSQRRLRFKINIKPKSFGPGHPQTERFEARIANGRGPRCVLETPLNYIRVARLVCVEHVTAIPCPISYFHSKIRQSRPRNPRAACRPRTLRAVVSPGMKGQQRRGTPETTKRGSGAMQGRGARFRCPLAAISTQNHGRATSATNGLHAHRTP